MQPNHPLEGTNEVLHLRQSLQKRKQRVELFLQQQLATLPINDQKLLDAMGYGLLQGGKRMRPYLVYTIGALVDAPEHDLDAPAGAIECMHSYSLIHDDLPAMDNDELRRGLPTVHVKYGEDTAILAGDSLQSLAFDLLANHQYHQVDSKSVVAMIQQLSRLSGYDGMCGGQAIDLASTDKAISVEQLEQMHRLKTGALIRCSVAMASYCSNAFSDKDRRLLNDFAHNIGLAFQIHDDILDVEGDTHTLGKPKGSDQQANKSTYVSLLGLQQAKHKAKSLYLQSLDALQQLPYDTQLLEAFASYVVQRNH